MAVSIEAVQAARPTQDWSFRAFRGPCGLAVSTVGSVTRLPDEADSGAVEAGHVPVLAGDVDGQPRCTDPQAGSPGAGGSGGAWRGRTTADGPGLRGDAEQGG